MRVIAGTRKRMPLKTVAGLQTRPTTDRIKETLFNIISSDIIDGYFLDLFAGSGQMGIEALSRGAKHAVFIEKDKRAIQCIRENLTFTKFTEQADVICADVLQALSMLKDEQRFDIIFIDPPYQMGIEKRVLEMIYEHHLLCEDGYIIIEADIHTDFSFIESIGFHIIKEKVYKTNKHIFAALFIEEKT